MGLCVVSNVNYFCGSDLWGAYDDLPPKSIRYKHFFEVEHPLHPKSGSYINHWKTWEKLNSSLTFEAYLEKIGFQYLERVIYFDDNQLEACETSIWVDSYGRCELSQGENKLVDGKYLFVLSLDHTFYVIEEKEIEHSDGIIEYYKHTSISRGEPVLSAGELLIENGLLVEVAMHSGHYYPGENEQTQIKRFLKKHQAKLGELAWPDIPEKAVIPKMSQLQII